jgi:hypothetical protein
VQSPPVRPAKERMLDPDEVVLRVREPAEKRRVRRRRRRRSAATTLEHNGSRLVAAIKRRLARA